MSAAVDNLRLRLLHGLPLRWGSELLDEDRARAVIAAAESTLAGDGSSPAAALSLADPLLVDQAVAAQRLAACLVCDRYRPDGDRCGMLACGCPLSDRARRSWGTCPDGRWPTA